MFGGPFELSQMTPYRFKDLYLKEEHIAGTIEEGQHTPEEKKRKESASNKLNCTAQATVTVKNLLT